jgi:sRNA-binding carbon storage regulator CsrA
MAKGNLVLSRQRDQSIVYRVPPCSVEQEIIVTVNDIRGDKVRISSRAADFVSINRAEVQAAIDAEATA